MAPALLDFLNPELPNPEFWAVTKLEQIYPAGEADRSLTNPPVSVLWTWQSAVAPTLFPFEFVSNFMLRISNLAPACPGWDIHA